VRAASTIVIPLVIVELTGPLAVGPAEVLASRGAGATAVRRRLADFLKGMLADVPDPEIAVLGVERVSPGLA